MIELGVLVFLFCWHEVGNVVMRLTPAERRIRRRAYVAAMALAGGRAAW